MAQRICDRIDKIRKKPPFVPRTPLILFAMVSVLYIFSICLRQASFKTNEEYTVKTNHRQQTVSSSTEHWDDVHYPKPDTYSSNIEHWDDVHYPKPDTYSREECARNPVRFFAILSMQRSGSGWFETLLNSHTNISSNGEIFTVAERRKNVSTILQTLDKVYNLDWSSSASKNGCLAAVGFKWMLNQGLMDHHEEIVKYFHEKGVSAIFLFRRNLLRRMISVLANSYDKDVKLLNGTHKSHVHTPEEAQILAEYKPTMNATSVISNLKQAEDSVAKAIEYFKTTHHIILYYEDLINNRTKLSEVQEFLRLPYEDLKSNQIKIHSKPLAEQVKNWDDILEEIIETPYARFLESDY